MSYGLIAVSSAQLVSRNSRVNPRDAWKQTLSAYGVSEKTCARTAWLGLCENGFVHSVSRGKYLIGSKSINNKRALEIRLLIHINTPAAIPSMPKLTVWNIACIKAGGNITKSDQGVIDVVYSLFMSKLLL